MTVKCFRRKGGGVKSRGWRGGGHRFFIRRGERRRIRFHSKGKAGVQKEWGKAQCFPSLKQWGVIEKEGKWVHFWKGGHQSGYPFNREKWREKRGKMLAILCSRQRQKKKTEPVLRLWDGKEGRGGGFLSLRVVAEKKNLELPSLKKDKRKQKKENFKLEGRRQG